MSRLFKALKNREAKRHQPAVVRPGSCVSRVSSRDHGLEVEGENLPTDVASRGTASATRIPQTEVAANTPLFDATSGANASKEVLPEHVGTRESPSIPVKVMPESRLVALTDPDSLGAEKFRALVTRLDHFRKQHDLTSFQVTSSVVNEGKTLVAGNVAVTLAEHLGSKTLLVEGDLHRPTLAEIFGLRELNGISQWWAGEDRELDQFIYRLRDIPLWFLPAGKACDRPSEVLRSVRFTKAFAQLVSQFEWAVVDSTPMLPIVDVNLWSRLVDGTLLVVREGVAPIKALKKGLQALDHPELIGVVMNEASGSDQANYDGQYYGVSKTKRAGQAR